jgi:hypothetical protein
MKHEIIWTRPPPLWTSPALKYVPERSGIVQPPEMLRFTTDSFMDDFMNILATEPERLREFRAQPETWRGFTAPPATKQRRPPSAVLRHLRLFRPPRRNGSDFPAGDAPTAPSPAIDLPLKLYQPAHQRHYLVASSLVCRVPGLPDRAVNTSNAERAGFVMRRLLPPANNAEAPVADWEEHAWIPGTRGNAWRRLSAGAAKTLIEGEELAPMFAVRFDEPDRPQRRLFAGVVPVGKREAYLGAPKANDQPQPGVTSRTARKILLRKEVIEPWKSLLARAQQVRQSLVPTSEEDTNPTAAQQASLLKIEREQIQTISWLILLDFARFLSTYLKPVWRAVLDPTRIGELNGAQATVYAALEASVLKDDPLQVAPLSPQSLREQIRAAGATPAWYPPSAVPRTLREALARYGRAPDGLDPNLEQLLEGVVEPYNRADAASRAAWPSFLFPLIDPHRPNDAPLPDPQLVGQHAVTPVEAEDSSLNEQPKQPPPPLRDHEVERNAWLRRQDRLDKLAVLIVRALEDHPAETAPEPEVPTAAVVPANALEGWFVIRCVYERPACAPLEPAVVSERTAPFQLAGFFDPDAPARPIRIGLPIDTTPAGLRKFDRNTAFVISNTLCGQIRRMKGLTLGDLVRSVLPWPLHKDLSAPDSGPCKSGTGLELGMICSLSIPIITLCALLLLMIIVSLLDIIFRWLPYFILCFPIPGLKAKP